MADAQQVHQLEQRVLRSKPQTLAVRSPAFNQGNPIPRAHAVDGDDVSPPLEWDNVPGNAQALALVVDDPDAPRGLFTHWTVWNVPVRERSLPKDASRKSVRSIGAVEGKNDFGNVGWNGPQPPSGTHRYFFRVFALDAKLDLSEGAPPGEVWERLQQHVLAWGELMGTFTKE